MGLQFAVNVDNARAQALVDSDWDREVPGPAFAIVDAPEAGRSRIRISCADIYQDALATAFRAAAATQGIEIIPPGE